MKERIKVENMQVLTEEEAAKYIGMSRSFLSADRMNGHRENRTKGPVYLKLGRAIRYRRCDLDDWLENSRILR